jgi:uncharacterized protein
MEERIHKLLEFCYGMKNNENGCQLYETYHAEILTITPKELILIQYEQLKRGVENTEMLNYVDKLMNIFYKPLSMHSWKRPEADSFIGYLIQENTALKGILERFKETIKAGNLSNRENEILVFAEEISKYNEHLLKLENILFPYLERKDERYFGFKVLWTLHDQTRDTIKAILSDAIFDMSDQEIIGLLGNLYFQLFGLIQKQELIVFPCAVEELSYDDLCEMHRQSFAYEFPYLERPIEPEVKALITEDSFQFFEGLFLTDTGHFDLTQLEGMLSVLPLDITLVDEHDKVAFFSKPKDRLFPRSEAVIGRDVRNCHPSESVHIVETILNSFKRGERDNAEFWIQMRGKFVYIQYVAIRDKNNVYRGTLEMTQDITGLRALSGERRLLNFE